MAEGFAVEVPSERHVSTTNALRAWTGLTTASFVAEAGDGNGASSNIEAVLATAFMVAGDGDGNGASSNIEAVLTIAFMLPGDGDGAWSNIEAVLATTFMVAENGDGRGAKCLACVASGDEWRVLRTFGGDAFNTRSA